MPPIVLATNNGDVGGGEVMLLRIAEVLTDLGHRVSVVAPSWPDQLASAAEAAGHRTIRLPATTRRQWMQALRRWDRQQLRGAGRGLLWCNGLVPAVATAGHRARIVHLHQKPLSTAQKLLAPVARFGALATLVPSQYMQAAFRGSVVLPNWTPPAAARTRSRKATDPFVVGFLGRLSTDKGVVTLAEAMHTLERRKPGEFRLLLAGEPRFVDPKDYAIVNTALTELGRLVDQPGWMDRDEFFSQVDVLAMPSQWGEPFGLGAAEAMAARVPVIVTADGALPEVVGPHGITVPTHDSAALADAIERAQQTNQTNTDSLYDRWRERFSPDSGSKAVAEFLESLKAQGLAS